jgi:FkbM family methyltransferase
VDIRRKITRRLNWYRSRFQINNPVVGRLVELTGNWVRMDGLRYSVATSQISTGHKSTLLFGLHELEERELVRRWIPRDIPVIEFGAGLGVVSCLTNRRLKSPSQHVVVEANPGMIDVLLRNREVNRCRFEVLNCAIAYDADTVSLHFAGEFVGSTVEHSYDGAITVATTSAAKIMKTYGFEQAGIICDIEGAESAFIERELASLGERIQYILAEMHPKILGAGAVDELICRLNEFGFEKRDQIGDCVFFSK